MSNMQIAETIRSQIKALDPAAFMAWAAKGYTAMRETDEHLGGLQFQTSLYGAKRRTVQVILTPADVYKVVVGKVSRRCWVELKATDEVYFDNLPWVIDEMLEATYA